MWVARAGGVRMPAAATLSTVTLEGGPAARMVSVKRVDAHGLLVGTSLASRKSAELRAQPRAALTFWWEPLGRQVRAEGRVEPVAREEAKALWDERGRANRLVTLISQQGRPLASRRALEEAFARGSERFGDGPIPCPHDWGAFRVVPDAIEFWQEDERRLIERELFVRGPRGEWESTLLQP
jgi:pyridoxamine 5'-phosphate oxidase